LFTRVSIQFVPRIGILPALRGFEEHSGPISITRISRNSKERFASVFAAATLRRPEARHTDITTVTKIHSGIIWNLFCSIEHSGYKVMSLHTSIRERFVPAPGLDHVKRLEKLWNVESTVSVAADKVRIFQALTVPEYIETWLAVPGPNPQLLHAFSPAPNEYRIDYRASDGWAQRISGHYRALRRSKLIFTWTKDGWPRSQSSLVWLRLIGDFSRTIVSVHHIALPSKEEQVWHQQLWDSSLKRLSSLFASSFRLAS
jgi:uncharacterized protein YndB with AHSA1/START domain